MRLRPVNDKIVVKEKQKEDDNITSGGIILPDTAHDGSLVEGEVVAAGNGMYSSNGTLIPVVVEVGDKILYSKNTHKSEHKIDGEEYIIMSVNEVMSVIEDKNEN
tara:strand:- start:1387 stop:1701 length:315 start_codon:yes stop_codon:yes gene_type:complete